MAADPVTVGIIIKICKFFLKWWKVFAVLFLANAIFWITLWFGIGENGDQVDVMSCSATGGLYSGAGIYVANQMDDNGHNVTVINIAGATIQKYGQPITPIVMVALFETGLQESGFKNYANTRIPKSLELPHDAVGHDHMSVGYLQQQVGMSWGTVEQIMDPAWATQKFLDRATKLNPASYGGPGDGSLPTTASGEIDVAKAALVSGKIAQKVQVSAFPDAYKKHYEEAVSMLVQLRLITLPHAPNLPPGGDILPNGAITGGGTCGGGGTFQAGSTATIHKYGNDANCHQIAGGPFNVPSGATQPRSFRLSDEFACNAGPEYTIAIPSGPVGDGIARALNLVQEHRPYRFAGGSVDGPNCGDLGSGCGDEYKGFDCSGLVSYAYGPQFLGLKNGRMDSRGEWSYVQTRGTVTSPANPVMGDLVFLANDSGTVHHVAIYLGAAKVDGKDVNLIVEESQSGDYAKVVPYSGSWDYAGHPWNDSAAVFK